VWYNIFQFSLLKKQRFCTRWLLVHFCNDVSARAGFWCTAETTFPHALAFGALLNNVSAHAGFWCAAETTFPHALSFGALLKRRFRTRWLLV